MVTPTAHVKVELPEFDESVDINTWFRRCNISFELANIKTEETKGRHILAKLPLKLLQLVPEELTLATEIKDCLIEQYGKSQSQRIDTLLEGYPYNTSEKPSIYMSKLKHLIYGLNVPEPMIQQSFMKAMPHTWKQMLVLVDKNKMVEMADKLFETDSYNNTYSTSSPVLAISRVPSNQKSRTNTDSNVICWYHIKFGKRSTKCTNWCHWPIKDNLEMRNRYTPYTSRSTSPSQNLN